MNRWALLTSLVAGSAAVASELPPISENLLDVSAISCVKMNDDGKVIGAYLIRSTGNPASDREIIAWVKRLHWDKAKPGEKLRNVWFPMPIAFGIAKPPSLPDSCGDTR